MVRFPSVRASNKGTLRLEHPVLTRHSQNCDMFYRRIADLEDEDNLTATSMPPRTWRDSETEDEGMCYLCRQPDRTRHRRDNKPKATDEAESDSDEEDYRGLSRIALVPRRKRTEASESVFTDLWASCVNSTDSATFAQQGNPRNFSCPFRKRNPTRFNIRDHGTCALHSFEDFATLK